MFDFEIKNYFKVSKIPLSNFVDPETLEVVYISMFGALTDQIIVYDYNWYLHCKAYFPPWNMYMPIEEKLYWGYVNLYELVMTQKQVYTLGLSNDDGSELVVNFNLEYGINESKFFSYIKNHLVNQIQWYTISKVVVNLKFPISQPVPSINEHESISSANSPRRQPPGFEDIKGFDITPKMPNQKHSSTSLRQFVPTGSPPIIDSQLKLARKRPKYTKSSQNWIAPLFSEQEIDQDTKMMNHNSNDTNSKGNNASDSISDQVDTNQIKEVDEFDSTDDIEDSKFDKTSHKSMNSQGADINSKSNFNFKNHWLIKPFGSNNMSNIVLPDPSKPVQSIYEYKDKIAALALTQQGSKYLQRVLTKASPDIVEFIILEIDMKLSHLMKNQYGNYFCQKLFQSASSHQRHQMLGFISSDFYNIAWSKHGTHSIQSLIEMINMDQEYELLQNSIIDDIFKLSYDPQGTYVIQKIIFCLNKTKLDYLFYPIIDGMFEIWENTHGLSVVKKIISSYKGFQEKT